MIGIGKLTNTWIFAQMLHNSKNRLTALRVLYTSIAKKINIVEITGFVKGVYIVSYSDMVLRLTFKQTERNT